MDRIHQLDHGIYSHFDFSGQQTPALLDFMYAAHLLSSYAGVGVLILAAMVLFLLRGQVRSAVVILLTIPVALMLIHWTQLLVPRARPDKAANWFGAGPGFPSPNALLFTLALSLLGLALWRFTKRRSVRLAFLAVGVPVWMWVSMSQFVLPLHYFSDVLGSFGAAGLIGWSAYLVMEPPSVPAPAPEPVAPPDAIQDLSNRHGIRS